MSFIFARNFRNEVARMAPKAIISYEKDSDYKNSVATSDNYEDYEEINEELIDRALNERAKSGGSTVGFDKDSLLECMEDCGIFSNTDVTAFDINSIRKKRSEAEIQWVSVVFDDLKRLTEACGTKIL